MALQSAFTLTANEIYDTMANMIISQQVFADNLSKHQTLVDKARVDGGLYGDTKLYYATDVLKSVGKKNCGSLPDFGNFYEYDRYQGVTDLMPYAKGVSAKSHVFDANGNERNIDYDKMMKIVKDAKYKGFVGIEYEGSELSEIDGIIATKKLLERYR